MKISFLILISVFILNASVKEAFPPPQSSLSSVPNLNDTLTVAMGEKMVAQDRVLKGDFIWVAGASGKLLNATETISRGYYYKYGKDSRGKYIYYKAVGNEGSWQTYGAGNKKSYDYIDYEVASKKVGNYVKHTKSEMDYRIFEDTTIIIENEFQQYIEYQGKSGTVLKFTYKESSGDLARPAFTTEFVFDLAEDNVLKYKGAVIEIIEAKGSSITYKVLNNFTD